MRSLLPRALTVALVAGAVAGLTLVGVAPANAFTAADCDTNNTITSSPVDNYLLIMNWLTSSPRPLICLNGTFDVPTQLDYGRDVTLLGLSAAVLHYSGTTDYSILNDTGIDNLTVQNLAITGGRNGAGNGAAINGNNVTVIDSTFDDNRGVNGGAISAVDATISGSTFTNNQAARSGGAVVASNLLTISGSTFSHNTADDGAGAVTSSSLTLDSSVFDSNQAGDVGGALSVNDAQVTNTTFVDNSVTDPTRFGATIVFEGGAVKQSTFVGNSINNPTGGQAIWTSGRQPLTVQGNIFADGTANAEIAIDAGGATTTDAGGNLFTTPSSAEPYFKAPIVTLDPSTKFGQQATDMFGTGTPALANNGGPVETIALPAGSTAIDAVTTASTVTVDARGNARTAPNDAGAYEYIAPVPAAPTIASTGATTAWLAEPASIMLVVGLILLLVSLRRSSSAHRK